jgi:hypothetical protein
VLLGINAERGAKYSSERDQNCSFWVFDKELAHLGHNAWSAAGEQVHAVPHK